MGNEDYKILVMFSRSSADDEAIIARTPGRYDNLTPSDSLIHLFRIELEEARDVEGLPAGSFEIISEPLFIHKDKEEE